MSARTETATTIHGDVEYEIVECCSCENDVAKEDASKVYAGSVQKERDWSHKRQKEVAFDQRDVTGGWVCQFCFEAGVPGFAAFPRASPAVEGARYILGDWKLLVLLSALMFAVGMLVGVIV